MKWLESILRMLRILLSLWHIAVTTTALEHLLWSQQENLQLLSEIKSIKYFHKMLVLIINFRSSNARQGGNLKKYCSIKKILRLERRYVWRCLPSMSSQTFAQNDVIILPQLHPKLHLINQIGLQTIDNMAASWKPNSRLEIDIFLHFGTLLSFNKS